MKRNTVFSHVALLVLGLGLIIALTAFAPFPALTVPAVGALQVAPPPPALSFDQALGAILTLAVGFASLVGLTALVAVLVNAGKVMGFVKDGASARWAAGLNLLAFIGLVAFRVFRPDITLEVLDGYAGQIATVAVFVLGFVIQMVGSRPAHNALAGAGVPIAGKSFSN